MAILLRAGTKNLRGDIQSLKEVKYRQNQVVPLVPALLQGYNLTHKLTVYTAWGLSLPPVVKSIMATYMKEQSFSFKLICFSTKYTQLHILFAHDNGTCMIASSEP